MFDALFRRFETWQTPFPIEQPTRPPKDLWPFIKHYARPFLPQIALLAALATLVAVAEVSLFALLGRLVDWLAAADRATFWDQNGTILIIAAVLISVGMPILKLFYETVIHQGMMSNFAMRTRWQAHRYVLRQSLSYFQNDFAGRVSAKVMQTSVSLREVVMKVSEVLVYVGVYFLGGVIVFAASDWRLAIPMVIWFIGYVIAMRYFVPRLGKISTKQADARSIMTGRIVDSYTNIATVKMFAHTDREDAYARESMDQFLQTGYAQMRLATLLATTLNTLNTMLITSVAGMAIYLWSIEAVTTGAIALSVGLVLRLQGMAHWIMWEVAGLFEHIGVVRDGISGIARDRSVVDVADAKPLAVKAGGIRYDHVHFDYGRKRSPKFDDGRKRSPKFDDGRKRSPKDASAPEQGDDAVRATSGIIEDLSLVIQPGEKVGIVGRSGAGKSTLVNVLLRFYDLESGRILIDDQDIAGVTQDSLRAAIGMVTQDTSLLHRSVLENITYGRPDATREAAVAAAKQAHAHDFILGLEDLKGRTGYEAHVGERGVKLSGGQRQRIAIARVLLKNAPILVLDEATSALDSEVEAAIQEQLVNLMGGKTVIAIAHRLSTIAAMDRLIIMDQGRIVEEGTHAELLDSGGLYADLWTRQSGGFLLHDKAA